MIKRTDEQQAIIAHKGDLVVEAVAGSGKTTTIIEHAKSNPYKKKMYLAFNSSVRKEMQEKAKKHGIENIEIHTTHSLAYKHVGKNYGKINSGLRPYEVCQHLKMPSTDDNFFLARLIIETFSHFCNSDLYDIDALDYKTVFMEAQDRKKKFIESFHKKIDKGVQDLWKMMENGKVEIVHDFYMKKYHLTRPNLKIDILYNDEMQDGSDIVLDIFNAQKAQRVSVGDPHQCLLPDTLISTDQGLRPIEDLRKGDLVITAPGNNKKKVSPVLKVHSHSVDTIMYRITTESGKVITSTDNHKHFADFIDPKNDLYYVYLMYKQDLGFRIGTTRTYTKAKAGRTKFGFRGRLNQEHAERLWILGVFTTEVEARYNETYLSITYSIPTTVFLKRGSGKNDNAVSSKQEWIDKVFNSIDTRNNSIALFKDKNLTFDDPHYIPKGFTGWEKKQPRKNFNIILNGGGKNGKRSSHMYTLNFTNHDKELMQTLRENGFVCLFGGCKHGVTDYYRIRKTSLVYSELLNDYYKLKELIPDLYLKESAALDKDITLRVLPAKNLIVGMSMLLENSTTEEIVSIEKIPYTGKVYDIEVERYHNYFANGVCTHNSIYSFKGAINAMNKLDFPRLYLSNSFRFNQLVADQAQRILTMKTDYFSTPINYQIKGLGVTKIPTRAILCRTNAAVLENAIDYICNDLQPMKVWLEGGLDSYDLFRENSIVYDIVNLYADKKFLIKNPFIKEFTDFQALKDYAEDAEDREYSLLCSLAARYKTSLVPLVLKIRQRAMGKNERREDSDLVISTVHKAKGMEYGQVQVSSDFITEQKLIDAKAKNELHPGLDEEINMLYVAATRTTQANVFKESPFAIQK